MASFVCVVGGVDLEQRCETTCRWVMVATVRPSIAHCPGKGTERKKMAQANSSKKSIPVPGPSWYFCFL